MTDSCPAGLVSTRCHASAWFPPRAPFRNVTHHRSYRSGPRWDGSSLANSGRICSSTGSSGTCRATAPLTVSSAVITAPIPLDPGEFVLHAGRDLVPGAFADGAADDRLTVHGGDRRLAHGLTDEVCVQLLVVLRRLEKP